MTDLQTRFRSLDEQRMPDLWSEIEARAQEAQVRPPRALSLSLVVVALLLLALAIGGAALIGSGVIKLPVIVDTPSTLPGPTSTSSAEPVGGRIVFGRSGLSGDFVIYLMDPAGGNASVLLAGAHECPRWSPDGRDISLGTGIFENAGQPNGEYRPFTTFDGPRYLPDPTLNLGCPVWSPDGSRLAYEGWDDTDPTRNGIYTLSAVDGSDLQRITFSPDGGHDIPGDFAPDGRELFFARWDGIGASGPLMVVGMDGSEPRLVASEAYGVPSLSPDGQTLLALRDGRLYLIAVDGSYATPISIPDAPSLGDFGPSWSPDGNWIVLSLGPTRNEWNIARIRPDGSGLFLITDNPDNEMFADWAP